MDTNKIIELLARKMAGEATAEELKQLDELILRYPDAVYYEEILKEIWEASAGNAEDVPDPGQAYLLHQLKYHQDFPVQADHATKSAEPSENMFSLAVGMLIVLLVCFTYWNVRDKGGPEIRISVAKGMRRNFVLPDGTLVWLNSGSKLSYAADFNQKDARKVHLEGEAFFDVKHLAGRPFIVHTEKISVKVLGTAFNIQAYPEDRTSEATLLRGSIELYVNGSAKQKVILSPSEKFAFREERSRQKSNIRTKGTRNLILIDHVKPLKIGSSEYIEETSWKDNRLVFKNESLAELKPKFERWFNVKISMESPLTGTYRFTGVFTKESITEALTAMQLIKPFTFKLSAHDVIIH
ncbi:FecR family protein [Pedobacter westerhofensis]|uniref:FecR family protein n=1 Tax=Pedobacter westerhofensis TaxID=425512 RepID=A0A521FGF1_9SPHI|nr:FecR domain-containing protein [Pedobacter westerhofensis]SMO95195.1 FecR family protein [Pedobacter westerhofensis]